MILENVSLKQYCTYKTGGNAKYFSQPTNVEELKYALNWAKEHNESYEILGGGANVLISDDGYDGLIISTLKLDNKIIHTDNTVTVGAGVNLVALVNYCISNSLGGLELLSGIPGTVGGAIKMNAGAFGQEIKDTLQTVTVLDNNCNIHTLNNSECEFGYRKSSGLDNTIIISATFQLQNSPQIELNQSKMDILKRRNEKQPIDKYSCGSVFKRPEGNYAGTLIENAGLKGYSIGGAIVSDKHANFILNNNNATSHDIHALINYVRQQVFEKSGIMLECEVKFIGF